MVKVSQSDYRAQMWTAEARCRVLNGVENINFSLQFEANQLIAIMPDQVFTGPDISQVVALATSLASKYRYEDSLCVQWDIKTCPPKPERRRLDSQQKHNTELQSQFMSRFLPVALRDYNIGSNAGLSRCLRELLERVTHAPQHGRYHVLMADVSIFERTLKVPICFIDILAY